MRLALSKNSHVRSDRSKELSDPAHSGLLNISTGYQILEDPKSMFSYMVAMHHLKRQPVMFNPWYPYRSGTLREVPNFQFRFIATPSVHGKGLLRGNLCIIHAHTYMT
jgi:hypothetical protein